VKPVERLNAAEAELQKLTKEYDALRSALGDNKLITWVAERGPVPRRLTAFETATVKRIDVLDQKMAVLEDECEELLSDVVCGLSGISGEPDDPEVLLRASLVVLNRLHKNGNTLPESLALMRALLRYLKSLANDEDDDE
jgi:hypothetical protein